MCAIWRALQLNLRASVLPEFRCDPAMELLILVLLIVVNGAFAMSEMAVVSSRKPRLQQWTDEGRRVPAGTQRGAVLRLRGKGLPHFGARRRGDLYIRLQVAVPEQLTAAERELYERLRAQSRAPAGASS